MTNIKTQNAKILKYLQTHKKGLTAVDAWNKFSIMRLSARIWDLREERSDKLVTF